MAKSLLQKVIDDNKYQQVNNEAHEDLTEVLPEQAENILKNILLANQLTPDIQSIVSNIQATCLSIYRQHLKNPLSSEQVQNLLNTKLDKQYHNIAWNILLKLVK